MAQFRTGRHGGAFRSAGRRTEGALEARAVEAALATQGGEGPAPFLGAPPGWADVEVLLAGLAATGTTFSTSISPSNWISSYEPGRRLRLESGMRSSWVQVDHLKGCWATFERLGRIRRRDVLEPGRCSAFVMALFGQLAGVDFDPGDADCLVLRPNASPAAPRGPAG